MKTRKLSISAKIGVLIVVAVALSVGILSSITYSTIKDYLVESHSISTTAIAALAADDLNAETFNSIVAGDYTDNDIANILEILDRYRGSNEVEYIYTMAYDKNGDVMFVVDSDPEDPADLFEAYDETTPAMLHALNGNAEGDLEISTDEWGSYISGYAPIILDGNVVGIVGVDCEVSYIAAKLATMMTRFFMVSAICILVGIVLAIICGRSLKRNFISLNDKILDVASADGNLSKKLEIHSGDEIEVVSESLNKLLDKTRNTVVEIKSSVNEIYGGSSEIAVAISTVGDKIHDISSTLNEMSSAMDNSVQQMEAVSSKTNVGLQKMEYIETELSDSEQTVSEITKMASDMCDKVEDATNSLRAQVETISNQLNEKLEATETVSKIGELTDTIISIADQTNLLALNASIEAARAGEFGKGFAVVASEIGNLADDSSNAAKNIQEIGAIIMKVVTELAEVSREMMNYVNTEIMNEYEQFGQFGEEYFSRATSISSKTTDIFNNTKELYNNLSEIVDATSTLLAYSEENAASIQTITSTIADLDSNMNSVSNETSRNKNAADHMNNVVAEYQV